ncbi:MAG: hypothetical protein CMJ48_12190, partial [Planctomycetaceae bacterium]|nr:hypothetical protein [Planctomycetaceae bacterium]
METKYLLILIPALPLLAAILTAIFGAKVLRGGSHWPTVIAIPVSFVLSAMLLVSVGNQQSKPEHEHGYEEIYKFWTWANVEDAQQIGESSVNFTIDITLRADALTAIMLTMVTFISSLIAIYSVGYMHH